MYILCLWVTEYVKLDNSLCEAVSMCEIYRGRLKEFMSKL